MVDAALAQLAERGRVERSFLWVHLDEPHRWKAPFMIDDSALEAVRQATPMDDEAFFAYVAELHGVADPCPGAPFDPGIEYQIGNRELNVRSRRDFLDMVDQYDALARQADGQLERLYRAVQELSGDAPTLWIVASDHGEGLLGHSVVGHGKTVFQEQVREPLVMHASDGSLAASGPRRVPEVVQLVDLFSHARGGARGARRRGRSRAARRVALAARARRRRLVRAPGLLAALPREDSGAEGVADEEIMGSLQTERSKVILRADGEQRFFDLQAAPRELAGAVDQRARGR